MFGYIYKVTKSYIFFFTKIELNKFSKGIIMGYR